MRINAGPARAVIARGWCRPSSCSRSSARRRSLRRAACSPDASRRRSAHLPQSRIPPRFGPERQVLDEPIDARAVRHQGFLLVERARRREGPQIPRLPRDQEPWFDRTIMSGVNGFQTYQPHHYVALPERRLFGADWFQPVVRVGSKGINDLPLKAVNVMPRRRIAAPDEADPARGGRLSAEARTGIQFGSTTRRVQGQARRARQLPAGPQAMLDEAQQVWKSRRWAGRIVAEFVAPDSGELFFYVNDAVQIFPRLLPESMIPSWLDIIQGPHDLASTGTTAARRRSGSAPAGAADAGGQAGTAGQQTARPAAAVLRTVERHSPSARSQRSGEAAPHDYGCHGGRAAAKLARAAGDTRSRDDDHDRTGRDG